MWIHEFRKLFDETAGSVFARVQNLESVEKDVARVFDAVQIGSSVLHAIESSGAWDYPNWWPRLSDSLDPPAPIPQDFPSSSAERRLIKDLYGRLRHIEVLSVVLRFVFPRQFGILSPPVTQLIALPPRLDHVEYYLDYLHILREFAEHYGGGLRVTDVEIALWTAARQTFQTFQTAHSALVEEMYDDRYFQNWRIENLIGDLGRHWRRDEHHRIMLAKALIKTDHAVAALIAARFYEWAVNEMAQRLNLPEPIPKPGQTKTGARVDKLKHSPRIKMWELSSEKIDAWWKTRNAVVHDDREPLTQHQAERFVSDMESLLKRIGS
ncbi:MAG: hypothetical protein EPN47_18950 [Acidobacteria bacterium]|nr:MAG: hypothetical protein EPN47_18950 [Acidobacteriota bacterium]